MPESLLQLGRAADEPEPAPESTGIGNHSTLAFGTIESRSPAVRPAADHRTAKARRAFASIDTPLLRKIAQLAIRPGIIAQCRSACQYGCRQRSEEHTSELQSLMRISSAVFCLKKKKKKKIRKNQQNKTHRINSKNEI